MEELKSKLEEAVTSLLDLTEYSMTQNHSKLNECFPATSCDLITINGKDYRLTVEINLTEVSGDNATLQKLDVLHLILLLD